MQSSSSSSYRASSQQHFVGQPQVTTTRYTSTSSSGGTTPLSTGVPLSTLAFPSIPLGATSSRRLVSYHQNGHLQPLVTTIPSGSKTTTVTTRHVDSSGGLITNLPNWVQPGGAITTTVHRGARIGSSDLWSQSGGFHTSGGFHHQLGGGFVSPMLPGQPLTSLMTSLPGGQTEVRYQKYEWRTGPDGVLRQVLVSDSAGLPVKSAGDDAKSRKSGSSSRSSSAGSNQDPHVQTSLNSASGSSSMLFTKNSKAIPTSAIVSSPSSAGRTTVTTTTTTTRSKSSTGGQHRSNRQKSETGRSVAKISSTTSGGTGTPKAIKQQVRIAPLTPPSRPAPSPAYPPGVSICPSKPETMYYPPGVAVCPSKPDSPRSPLTQFNKVGSVSGVLQDEELAEKREAERLALEAAKAEETRQIRMRAAAERLLLFGKKAKVEREAREAEAQRRAEVEAQIERLDGAAAQQSQQTAQQQAARLETMTKEIETLRAKQQAAESAEIRRLQEEMARMKLEAERQKQERETQKAQEDAENRRKLEEELTRIREAESERIRLLEAEMVKRKEEEEAQRRKELDDEFRRLQQEEAERVRRFEAELHKLQAQAENQEAERLEAEKAQLRREQEVSMMEIRAQQNALQRTIKLEEEAKLHIHEGDKFLAVEHGFRSLVIRPHSFIFQTATPISSNQRYVCSVGLDRENELSCEATLLPTNSGYMLQWEDLLTFPYANERYLRLRLEQTTDSSSHQYFEPLCGVKIDLEDFLLRPMESCGRHDIVLMDNEAQNEIGTISVSVHLSGDFIEKAYASLKSRPIERQTSDASVIRSNKAISASAKSTQAGVTSVSKSSIINPYQSVHVHVHQAEHMPDLQSGERKMLCCRTRLGDRVLTSEPLLTIGGSASVWGCEFGFSYASEKFLKFEIFDPQSPDAILGELDLDLDSLLLDHIDSHSATFALKARGTDKFAGCIAVTVSFSLEAMGGGSMIKQHSTTTSMTEGGRTQTTTEQTVQQFESGASGPPPSLILPGFDLSHFSRLPIMGGLGVPLASQNLSILQGGGRVTHHLPSPSHMGLGSPQTPSHGMSGDMLSGAGNLALLGGSDQLGMSMKVQRPTTCRVQVHGCRNLMLPTASQKLEPYVKVILGNSEAKTSVARKPGPSPRWRSGEASFTFNIEADKIVRDVELGTHTGMVRFEVWDKAAAGERDRFVGFAELSFVPLILNSSSGYFGGDLQVSRVSPDGATSMESGIVNVTIETL